MGDHEALMSYPLFWMHRHAVKALRRRLDMYARYEIDIITMARAQKVLNMSVADEVDNFESEEAFDSIEVEKGVDYTYEAPKRRR